MSPRFCKRKHVFCLDRVRQVRHLLFKILYPVSRFLTVAGLCNGCMINYSNISRDAEVPKSTVMEYFQILRDTLVGDDLPAWKRSSKRKPISTSKFYFFDIGVARFLQNRQGLRSGSPEFGEAFEAYMHHEIRSYCDYQGGGDLAY